MGRPHKPSLRRSSDGRYFWWANGRRNYFGREKEQAKERFATWIKEQTAPIFSLDGDDRLSPAQEWQAFTREVVGGKKLALVDSGGMFGRQNGRELTDNVIRAAEKLATVAEKMAKPVKGHLREALEFYLRSPGHGKKTADKIRCHYLTFLDRLKNKRLMDLTREDFVGFAHWLAKQNRSNDWRDKRVTAVKGVLRCCLEVAPDILPAGIDGWLKVLKKCKPDSDVDPTHARAYPAAEWRAVLKASSDLQFRAIWYLGANCALNLTDFARITWGALHLSDSKPYLELKREKKGKILRMTPLAAETIKAIKRYRASLPAHKRLDHLPAFLCRYGSPLAGRQITDRYKTVAKQAGVNEGYNRMADAHKEFLAIMVSNGLIHPQDLYGERVWVMTKGFPGTGVSDITGQLKSLPAGSK